MMKKKKIEIDFFETTATEGLDTTEARLINKAKSAARKAYAPYSGFSVGAAVLLENGEIITGSNQENAAYPQGFVPRERLCTMRDLLSRKFPLRPLPSPPYIKMNL